MKARSGALRLPSPARWLAVAALALAGPLAHAGAQLYEPLAASVQAALHSAVSDAVAPDSVFVSTGERARWLQEMSARLVKRIPDQDYREDLLKSVHYEATRAGLDPQLVLGLIQVESGFRKYALSTAGARGYMQVMPFWMKLIGRPDDNLFHLRTNLRYGCTILRHYLDMEKGNLFRALGRYNGSLGRAEYPNMVRAAWERQWPYPPLRVAEGGPSARN
jgi:soluble lytic murein transglycosylase-like protein